MAPLEPHPDTVMPVQSLAVRCFTLALPAFVLALLLGAGSAGAQSRAQAALPITTLQAGIHLIRAEVADDDRKQAIGLMHRESLEPNHGMLFVFQEKAGHCFWMRNTLIPLSIAFIDDDGIIVNIADMTPLSEASHCAARPVRFALEMTQGWFDKRGIGAGYRLAGKQVFRATP
jgi:uncharacterized membrane protein (UPF0127 family)